MSIELSEDRTRHSPEVETAMYRIVQEALTNAAKHGNAKRAIVEVDEDDAEIRVRVRDDGRGFDTSAHTDGFGLLGMQERVQLLDGTFEIDSSPSRGTTIEARFPIRRILTVETQSQSQATPG
jgi:signal transduction histidine kinase